MGSDSAAVADDDISVRAGCSKAWKCRVGRDHILVGFAGHYAEGLYIRHGFQWPKRKPYQSMDTWLVAEVQPALQKSLAERFEQRKGIEIEWSLLIATKPGRIFALSQCGDVEECESLFAAIGSGKTAALGCLEALKREESALVSWERVDLALRVSETFTSSVRGPFHLEALV